LAKKRAEQATIKKTDNGLTISAGKKSISIGDEGGPLLQMTNEYGNTISYKIEASSFEGLWDHLWQFVKDSQH
jgi:hypothetical protein